MNWRCWHKTVDATGGSGGPKRPPCVELPKPMTLGPVRHVGEYIEPQPRRQIWAFDIILYGKAISFLTANDDDLAEQRKLGERIVFAYNEVFANERSSKDHS